MNKFTSSRCVSILFCTAFVTLIGINTALAQPYQSYAIINTFAGKGGDPYDSTRFSGITTDQQGNYYYTDSYRNQVFKFDKVTNNAVLFAGTGAEGYSGDGGLATQATFNSPVSLAIDSRGNIYVSDAENHRIRKINKVDGIISTVSILEAGVTASINNWGIAIDALDNLYFADYVLEVIRKVPASGGNVQTVIGKGGQGYGGTNIPALTAQFNGLKNFCIDAAGNFYLADKNNFKVRKMTAATGLVTDVDGGVSLLGKPNAVTVDATGNLYITDIENSIILKYNNAMSTMTLLAGSPTDGGFWGNGVSATAARLTGPDMLLVDRNGDLVFTQTNYQYLRKVNLSTSQISTVYVQKGSIAGDIGDGGNADLAQFNVPRDVAVDKNGNVYLADGINQRIRRIDHVTHIITTIAGTGEVGFSGDGGPATLARFKDPAGMAFDNAGNLLIADRYNNCIRKVDITTGIITTIAGVPGTNGIGNIGGRATLASFYGPTDIVVDKAGNIYISTSNDPSIANIIYKITTDGRIHFFAGRFYGINRPNYGYSGDGGPATAALLASPHGMVIDSVGNLIFCDKANNVIRKVDGSTGIISTIAGTGTPGNAGDGGPALNAQLSWPDDIAIAPGGNLIIADLTNNQMRLLDVKTNKLYTVAGKGAAGFAGDGGQATEALLNGVDGMAIDQNGRTYIADQFNNRIRTFPLPSITPGALPVILINFRATALAQDVVLQWSTTSEQNSSMFIIERSVNGQDSWQSIGTVAALGNSSIKHDYSFTDKQAPVGKNYYRLKQVDLDLTSVYSSIIAVAFNTNSTQQIEVYPNPVKEMVTVSIPVKTNSIGTLRIVNGGGATIITRKVNLNAGTNVITIPDLKGLQPGVYFLQVNLDGNTNTIKKLLKM